MIAVPKNPYSTREFIKFFLKVFRPKFESSLDPNYTKRTWKFSDASATENTKIGFVGDILPARKNTLEFSQDIIDFFADCDYVVGNFEGIISNQASLPFIQKHTADILTQLLKIKPANRWILSLANNHVMDFGEDAFFETKKTIEEFGMRAIGLKDSCSIELTENITLHTWTEWINGESDLVEKSSPLTSTPNDEKTHIAYPHWGYEFESFPRKEQIESMPTHYQLVVGHHPHFIQPIQFIKNTPIAWSLGNFATEIKKTIMQEGRILKATINLDESNQSRVQSLDVRNLNIDVLDGISSICLKD